MLQKNLMVDAMQSRLEEQLRCKLVALLAQKGSMTQEVSKRFGGPQIVTYMKKIMLKQWFL